MIDKEIMREAFSRNMRIIQMQTDGLTHADTLLQPPARGNCLNWVLGHIMGNRDSILKLLDEQPLLTEAEKEKYARESEPVILEDPDVIPLERFLELLPKSQEMIENAFEKMETEDFEKEIGSGERTSKLGNRLHFFYFHETYHCGQTEFLRQLAGTDDKVI
ncbi:MAG: hypothetical protein FVQ83_14015 [Chloroflexi bacterium]|nr:hypothetical protein [Chloroflexota bacterium]